MNVESATGGALELLSALQRLDVRLSEATACAQTLYGAQPDPFRGLHIQQEEVERSFGREPGSVLFWTTEAESLLPGEEYPSSLARLRDIFDLATFDLDIILLALATEMDLRYERIFAYLQDDVTRRRPTVELTLNLLCNSPALKIRRRTHYAENAPLLRYGLLHLSSDPQYPDPPLLGRYLKLDKALVEYLLAPDVATTNAADGREYELPEYSNITPPPKYLPDEMEWVTTALRNGQRVRLFLQGARGTGKKQAAAALAAIISAKLLVVNLERLPTNGEFGASLRRAFLVARLQNAMIYMADLEELRDRAAHRTQMLEMIMAYPGSVVIGGTGAWLPDPHVPLGVQTVRLKVPTARQREIEWRACIAAFGGRTEGPGLRTLANRFVLGPAQIQEASAAAAMRYGDGETWALADLERAARAQSGQTMMSLSTKVEPCSNWEDLVLPADTLAQLREFCDRAVLRSQVVDEWGFGDKLTRGTGTSALFAGPSGTGKTMAAEVIAGELGFDLYQVDLSRVVSKYIGETEKNLEQIFNAAEGSNGILFFDEADALFGKRSEVSDAHDRYANLEISYLLQKIEGYEGIAILSTNLRQNLDEAFLRRLAFIVSFPFPDASARTRIWSRMWPPGVPLASNMRFDLLAQRFNLSGGSIKNICLAASFLAAQEGDTVGMQHILQAIRREYQKLGKTLSAEELNPMLG